MAYKLISLELLHLARLVGLVRRVEPVELAHTRVPSWGLLVRGRGFDRLLKYEPVPMPGLSRPLGCDAPRPHRFTSKATAINFAAHVGVIPRRQRWDTEAGR
jgi:hypothetical protein